MVDEPSHKPQQLVNGLVAEHNGAILEEDEEPAQRK